MANVGETFKPGQAAPEAGTYQCSVSGCTGTFNASVKGVPLPPAHCAGAAWKLGAIKPAASAAPAGTSKPVTQPTRPPKR